MSIFVCPTYLFDKILEGPYNYRQRMFHFFKFFSMEKKVGRIDLGGITVKVVEGDVTCQRANCIVVPEFCNCASLGGVGGACASRGLSQGMKAYDKRANTKPFAFGDVLLTDGGRNNILLGHVVTVDAPEDKQFEVVYKAMFEILGECNQKPVFPCRRIAVPELGTGIIGSLTQEQSARAIIGAVDAFSRFCGATSIEEVVLCVYNASTAPAEKVLEEGSYRDFKPEAGQKPFDPEAWLQAMCGSI